MQHASECVQDRPEKRETLVQDTASPEVFKAAYDRIQQYSDKKELASGLHVIYCCKQRKMMPRLDGTNEAMISCPSCRQFTRFSPLLRSRESRPVGVVQSMSPVLASSLSSSYQLRARLTLIGL
jgi:hypothetical protein